jgi:hypothetical protein
MKTIHIIGGGTISHVRTHLALAAPAYGATARQLYNQINDSENTLYSTQLHLTKMADHESHLETWDDLSELVDKLIEDKDTKVIFFNPAIVDFEGQVGEVKSDKHAERLQSSTTATMVLRPYDKLISRIRAKRKDIFLVGFKATSGDSFTDQYEKGLRLLKQSSCNLVLANDVETKTNMIIVPEEAVYSVTTNRSDALDVLIGMTLSRSTLKFTRTTVVPGEPVKWQSSLIPDSLRTVVDYCVQHGAYKKFLGVTAGHFAFKVNDSTFVTSRRKTDFNDLYNVGMVLCESTGPDEVIAHGSKPSVGGQSQRIIFKEHPEYDCIVHFHCVRKSDSEVLAVNQMPYECGSHECGANTSHGLKKFGDLSAVYLDNHGPNIVFNRSIDPKVVIDFINSNFDLSTKSGMEHIAH